MRSQTELLLMSASPSVIPALCMVTTCHNHVAKQRKGNVMNKALILLSSITAIALTAPAFAADTTSASVKTEQTDAAGTTTTSAKDVKVKTDASGNTTKTVKTKDSTDPKGLMNKKTSKTKEVTKTDSNGNVVSDTTETK